MASKRTNRLPLSGRSPRRLSFELHLKLWLLLLAVPALALAAILAYRETSSLLPTVLAAGSLAVLWAIAASSLFERIIRPLQTLSNVVAALREDDFSFRARGAGRGDSLGDLALEINALASTLQHQRVSALDALTLVELVMNSMPSPVMAFDATSRLRLRNPAADRAFALDPQRSLGNTAEALNLSSLLKLQDHSVLLSAAGPANTERWSVYRTTFRLHGIPHVLFVLADVGAALREEERLAWQRLIRVLGHEINNSLTPIKSIAGSLRSRLPDLHADHRPGFDRGLAVIEDRASSLNRFLQAYQRLSRLPPPDFRPVPLGPLVSRVVPLETRLPVQVLPGTEVTLLADQDQLEQLLINLLRNAADAALSNNAANSAVVRVTWHRVAQHVVLRIVDNGPGLSNPANLFVPFYTTKPGGTGLGLVLVQQIATAHHGTITLGNRHDGIGCEAEVQLPFADSERAVWSQ